MQMRKLFSQSQAVRVNA